MPGQVGFFLDSRPLKMGLICCPEMSVRNYHYLLLNNPEKCSSHLGTTLTNQNNMHDKLIGLNMGTTCNHMVLVKVKVKVFPVYTMNAYQGSAGIIPLILNINTWWRLVVSFTPWQLYPWGWLRLDQGCISVWYLNTNIKMHRSITLPVLCGCETWSLTFTLFKNGLLRKTVWPEREEVTQS